MKPWSAFVRIILAIHFAPLSAGAEVSAVKPNSRPLESLKLKEGDEKGNDLKALQTELLVTNAENKALQQLNFLLRKHKGTPLEPELRMRLAELYMRRSKTDRFFEMSRSSSTLIRFLPQFAKSATSKGAIHQAVEVYEKLARDFPDYDKLDLVLFNTAFARQQLAQPLVAEKLYQSVIQRFPYSPLIPDTHLAIGEIEFDRQKFSVALEHFEAIQKYPNSRVYPYGIYKSGWALYNLKRNVEGLKALERVIEYGRMVEEKKLDARLDLRKEALADMTIFFEDVFPAAKAYTYFQNQAKPDELAGVLIRLSDLYQRHSRHQDRKTVLIDFIRKLSDSEMLPEAYDGLVHNYEDMRDRKEAVSAMKSFEDVCDPEKSWARKKNATHPEFGKKCLDLLSETSLNLARKWNNTWRKNQGYPEFADAAEKAFEIYLRRSPVSHEQHEARYAFAELLFQRNQFRRASEQYALTSQPLAAEPMGHDAAYASLLSLEKAVGDKWSDADEKQFQTLAQFYLTHFTKGQYRLDIEFKLGLIAYEKERYADAAPVFLRLGQQHPQKEKGLKSQDLYLDILNIKKDYSELKRYSAQLLKGTTDRDRIAKLQRIYRESYFIEVQKMEEGGKLDTAAADYKKFAKENMTSDLAPKAWWNAMQIEFRTFQYMAAAQDAEAYFDQFPKSTSALDALLRAAQTYESLGQLQAATRPLLRLAAVDSKNALKWKILAADFLALSHQAAQAEALYVELKDQKSDGKIASYALDKYIALQKTKLEGPGYFKFLEKLAKSGMQPQASYAKVELVENEFKQGDATKAFADAKDVMNMGEAAAVRAKARARYVQAMILKDEFIKASLKSKMDRIAMVLAIKTEKLEKAQSAFESVIRFGDPQTTIQALQQLADCYTHFVSAFRNFQMPEGMTPADEQTFRSELQRLSIPLEEKGVDTIAQALSTAKKMNLYDGSVARLQAQLDLMNMKKSSPLKVDFQSPALALPKATGVGS